MSNRIVKAVLESSLRADSILTKLEKNEEKEAARRVLKENNWNTKVEEMGI